MLEKVHTFPGNIKITVEELDKYNVKVNIDTGDINFKSGCLPKGFNGSGSSTSHRYKGEKYYNIPTIFMDRDDDSWWINLSCLDGEHNICYGRVVKFPYTCTKDWCEKFLQGFTIVVNTLVAEGYIKEEEIMFNGLNDNVESVVYDFDGCKVTVGRVRNEDKFTININPGPWDFDVRKLECVRDKYAFEVSFGDKDWWIPMWDYSLDNHFNNGDKFSIERINSILLNVKGGVESRKKLIKFKEMVNKYKIKLMTREEMLDLIHKKELLSTEICKLKYENFKQFCIENNIKSCDELDEIYFKNTNESFDWVGTCALCEVYAGCSQCPLTKIRENCGTEYSAYQNMKCYNGRDITKFISYIDDMIKVLEKAVEYEKNQNKKEEVYYAGKMKITLIPTECDKYKIKIDGMKSYAELPEEYYNTICKTKCYYNSTYTAMGVYDVNKNRWLISAFDDCKNIIRTHEDAMEIVECLKECSNILHEINEPKVEITNIGKMILKAEKISNDVYQCSIEGMKEYNNLPHEYIENRSIINCCVFNHDNRFTISNKYYKNFIFSQYNGPYDNQYVPIDSFKVTSEELIELKKLLKTCSENLHEINHKYKV